MRYATVFLFIIIVVMGTFMFSQRWVEDWAYKKRVYPEEILFTLERGQSLKTLSVSLESQGVLKPAWMFELWVRFKSDYTRFQAGNYRAIGELSAKDLIDMLIAGDIYEPTALGIMIPEGFTLKQIANRIASNGLGSANEIMQLGQSYALLQELGISGDSLEGYLFPAYYTFSNIPTAEEILKKMHATFRQRLPENYEQQVEELGLSLHQAVTFASLIELETPHDFEREMVAEVIWNRLKARMTLGIDASIIYGIPNFDGDLKFKDLSDRSNLYNTRIHIGLPPGPIGSPSTKSLQAVLNPTKHGYYYYVIDVPTREHYFSKDLKEHNERVRKMLSYYEARRQADKSESLKNPE